MATYRVKIEGRDEYDEGRLLREAWIRWQAQQRELPEEREAEQARCRDLLRNRPSRVGGPSRPRRTAIGTSAVLDDGDDADTAAVVEDAQDRPGWRTIQHAGGLDEYLAEQEDREALRVFLRLLFVHAPAQWEAVEMCLLDGMGFEAVAQHLDIARPSVAERVSGAARHLRRALDDVRLVRRMVWRHAPRLVEEWAVQMLCGEGEEVMA